MSLSYDDLLEIARTVDLPWSPGDWVGEMDRRLDAELEDPANHPYREEFDYGPRFVDAILETKGIYAAINFCKCKLAEHGRIQIYTWAGLYKGRNLMSEEKYQWYLSKHDELQRLVDGGAK